MSWNEKEFIEEYEQQHGRQVIKKLKQGEHPNCDYISKDLKTGEERHIEVKKRKNMVYVFLTRPEFNGMKGDKKYYLYWVYWDEGKEPRVLEMPQEDVLKEGHIDWQFVLTYKKNYEKYVVK